MLGHREQMEGGAEFDALTRARRIYKYLRRPGVAHGIKKRFSRRVRREQQAEVAAQLSE